jgi:hypothetical protein
VAENDVIKGVDAAVIGAAVGKGVQHFIDGFRISCSKTSGYSAH